MDRIDRRTTVVGGGVVGAAIAFELQRRGRRVQLVERGELGKGTAFGSMASIAVTEFLPSSRPSVWKQIPGWVADPEGPIRLRPGYMPKLAPWMMRFVAAGLPSRVRELEAAGAVLCRRVYDDLLPLLDAAGLPDMLTEEGCLSLYADDAEFRADRDHIAVLERYGFEHQLLDGEALREREPEISPVIGRAVLFPQNRSVRDTQKLVVGLVNAFRRLGGELTSGEVVGFERGGQGVVEALRLSDGRRLACAETILCAGAYTARLSRLLDEPIPLETERGYSTQIMSPGLEMRHSIIWPARAFMVTPTSGGLRVGGTVEMAGLDAPPDYRRARVLVKRAQIALPKLRADDAVEWMGHRPALPDTVPIIGPSAKHRGLYYATGHGHLGVTYAATTARLIGDLVLGAEPPVDLRPFRVDRF